MSKTVETFFPQGQRKLIVSLIAMAVAIGFEKFTKQGLSEEMKTSLIALVAIFTGGNVMEHFANAIKVLKGTKVGGIVEDILPGDQGLRIEAEKEEEVAGPPDFTAHIQELYAHAKSVNAQLSELSSAQKLQAENTQKLIGMVNAQRGSRIPGSEL